MQRTIFLALSPRATARTRCGCRGRFPNVYNEPAYAAWKNEAIRLIREIDPPFPVGSEFEGDVWVSVEVIFARPKSTKKLRPKGDRDNLEKGPFDAITQAGGWWKDDDQIVEGPFLKRWANPGEVEGYKLTIRFRPSDMPGGVPGDAS